MNPRKVILPVTVAILAGAFVIPAGAASGMSSPVTVSTRHDEHGVGVGVGLFGNPGAGVSTYDGRACVGLSYEVPFCTDVNTR